VNLPSPSPAKAGPPSPIRWERAGVRVAFLGSWSQRAVKKPCWLPTAGSRDSDRTGPTLPFSTHTHRLLKPQPSVGCDLNRGSGARLSQPQQIKMRPRAQCFERCREAGGAAAGTSALRQLRLTLTSNRTPSVRAGPARREVPYQGSESWWSRRTHLGIFSKQFANFYITHSRVMAYKESNAILVLRHEPVCDGTSAVAGRLCSLGASRWRGPHGMVYAVLSYYEDAKVTVFNPPE
jgi:hypothetical protein